MVPESIKSVRTCNQLGLPPMELAESSNERSSRCLYRCIYPTLQKVFIMLLLITLSAGLYVLILKLLNSNESTQNTEIILVTGGDTHNVTVHQNDWEIWFHINNQSDTNTNRGKRSVTNPFREHNDILNHLDGDNLKKAKEIILKHNTLCLHEEHKNKCTELINKLNSLINHNKMTTFKDKSNSKTINNEKEIEMDNDHTYVSSTDVLKRETNQLNKINSVLSSNPAEPLEIHIGHGLYHNQRLGPHLPDTCLLAKLLKQSYPQAQEIYDPPSPEALVPQTDHSHTPQMRYFQPSISSVTQSREIESHLQKLHPQDLNIFMNFLNKQEKLPKEDTKKSSRTIECPLGSLPCDNNEDCVDENQWCDGSVDCADASDEIRCSCKSRVDKARLCDGYFDCPFGEDELGCFGCSGTTFSCGNSQNTCFTKEQRCNSVNDCSNHKDEIECNMLAPSLHKKPLFAISNTEGYLHRNFKGDWYAVCQNPYMWAHDACRRETGLIIRPPIIQIVPIDPTMKVNYLNTGPGGLMHTSDTCFNSSAVYVTCPDFLCGTRVQTTTQSLRQNMDVENHLFGRNKRFLYPKFNSYRMIYYGNRMKRDISATINKTDNKERNTKIMITETNNDKINSTNDNRNKRAEERVVGGKASLPAAWPWMVAIYRDGMFHCGGVILTQSWIISAAHCLHKFWDHYYEVQVGMLRRFSFSPQEQNHRVAHVIVNHHYNQNDMNGDLSLLKVEPAIQFSRWVRPICLPGPHTAGPDWMWGPAPGTVCTAVGWGATIEHGPDPDHLREVELPIWEHCKHREDMEGKEICAGLMEGGKDACQGDSGGPLLCRNPLNSQQWFLAGIVSHGDGCARKGEPGVYTRVSLFVKWIRYHISSKSLPLVQPKQECPGFKCLSGISKCLPNIRKCDKIVDCLDAEDETNCDIMRSSNDLATKMANKTKDEKKSEKISREVETESFPPKNETKETESPKLTTIISLSTTEKVLDITTNFVEKVDDNNINDHKVSETKLSTKSINETEDFAYASTFEISPTKSSETVIVEDSQNITDSPLSKETIETWAENETHSFVVTFKPDLLESRSSVLEQSKDSDIESTTKTNNDELLTSENADFTTVLSSTHSERFITSTHRNRGDSNLEEETNSINSFTIDPVTDIENNKTVNPDNMIVQLSLPALSHSDKTTVENEKNKIDDTKLFENNENTEDISAKILPDIEDKNDLIKKMEDIVLSELQLASIKRKPRFPKEFECRRIFQFIPYNRRCDRKADCEDGTDELDCTCTDYLTAFDETLICDGIFDCADGQDEIDCFSCPEDHFLCKRSEICLPTKYVCDEKAHCPLGEDEQNCFALSNGREMFYDIDEKPKINLEGFLTKRKKNDWQVVCDDKLSIEQQEDSAAHICRYLGFSSANKYFVKYVNVKNEDVVRSGSGEIVRSKRGTQDSIPVHFAFTELSEDNRTARNIVIKEPQVLKEECVPNVTKTCKSLYVFCDRALYTNFDIGQNIVYNRAVESINATKNMKTQVWPWIAKVYVDGDYKCTGILIDLAWVLVSDSCLWDTSPTRNLMTVVLGSHRTLDYVNGWYEQVRKVNVKKVLYKSRAILLHLKEPAQYSNMVKPMSVSSPSYPTNDKIVCVAIGEDNNNHTISVIVNETTQHCKLGNRCFVRCGKENICPAGSETNRKWSGLISCHSDQGWYPAASFVDSRGECGLGDHIVATDMENLRQEIKFYSGKMILSDSKENTSDDIMCQGVRCGRGRCVPLLHMCDGVNHCEDGNDESDIACTNKRFVCANDPFQQGCECSSSQMKCKNGKCISKTLFRDGNDDCEDGTDEPIKTSCSDYLATVMPSKLCDGTLHCHDRSDENPMFCKCFAKQGYKCSTPSEVDYCVASDMVCDGIRDCPNGDDERNCIGLGAPEGTPYGTGQVIVRSHGVWRSKCYPTQNHTMSELEAICSELGFLSGHAKKIKDEKYLVYTHNNLLLEPFTDVVLNNQTVIKMRNPNEAVVVKTIFDADLKNCFPVFIECL